jgi:hypothetical protein
MNSLLRSITTDSGLPVFTSIIPYMMGPNVGSALATSRKLPEILELRNKIAVNAVTSMYWYCREILHLSDSCIMLLLKTCNPEIVLLIAETEWNADTWIITTPFEDAADEFVQTATEEGIVLDTSAMEEQPTK